MNSQSDYIQLFIKVLIFTYRFVPFSLTNEVSDGCSLRNPYPPPGCPKLFSDVLETFCINCRRKLVGGEWSICDCWGLDIFFLTFVEFCRDMTSGV